MFGLFKRKVADRFRKCKLCKSDSYTPRGRGEILERWGWYYARRFFTCDGCGVKYLLYRRLDQDRWSHSMNEC